MRVPLVEQLTRQVLIARAALKYISPVHERAGEALDAMSAVTHGLPCVRCVDETSVGYHSCEYAGDR